MTRYSVFDSPLLLGFDHLERLMETASKSAGGGYPPYNIEQLSDQHLRISLAVAGFSMDDLDVSVEDKQLIIRGAQADSADDNRIFLHRGIAARQFQRNFVLSEDIEVEGAHLDNGLLHIELRRILPQRDIRSIKIQSTKKSEKQQPMHIDMEADDEQ